MGNWNRLHPSVTKVTLEKQLRVARERIKHENSFTAKIKELNTLLSDIQNTKQSVTDRLDLDETVCIIALFSIEQILLMILFVIFLTAI